jgi:outer membrane protein assembly factor BamB
MLCAIRKLRASHFLSLARSKHPILQTPATRGFIATTARARVDAVLALYAIKVGKTGDLTGTESLLRSHNKGTPYVPSPLLTNDRLYFFSSNNEILSCFDMKAGKPHYEGEHLEGVYASPIAANGRVYLAGRNGVTAVIKDSDKLEVLATNTLDEQFDASPVAVGKELPPPRPQTPLLSL